MLIKKATPIVLSVALSLGASTAMAGQSSVDQVKKVHPQTAAQKVSKPAQTAPKATAPKNSQAVSASKKIELTSDRAIIQRKGPGHVA